MILLPAQVTANISYRPVLREFEGNVTQAAARAGMERESLHRLLKRYGLRSDDFRPRG